MKLANNKFLNLLNLFKKIDIFSVFVYFLIFIIFLRTIEQLFGKSTYDWDIDHLMYFSGRLLKGELVYVKEFDDKLPLVQYLFIVPAYFKNVNIWTLFSILISFYTSFKIFIFLKTLSIKEWQLKNSQFITKAAILSSFIYLFFIASLNGSFSHINAVETSFSILALISYTHNFQSKLDQNTRILNIVKSSIYAAISISIRPYFAAAILLVVLWNNLRKNNLIKSVKKRKITSHLTSIIKELLIYIFFIFIFGIFLNITPYIIQGNIKYFINGIDLNFSGLHPTDSFAILKDQLKLIFIDIGNIEFFIFVPFFIIFAFLIFPFWFLKNKNIPKIIATDLIFFSILFPLSIFLIILNKHFWSHYIQFYSAYSAISIFFIAVILKLNYEKIYDFKIKKQITLFFIIALLTFLGRFELIKSIYKFGAIGRNHYMQNNLQTIERFIDQRNAEGNNIDFLYPNGIYVHWKLEEPRYGFPQSAHFWYIKKGYWTNVKLGTMDNEDYSSEGFCQMVRENSPTLIFTEKDSYIYRCLNSAKKDKREKVSLMKDLYVFIKD